MLLRAKNSQETMSYTMELKNQVFKQRVRAKTDPHNNLNDLNNEATISKTVSLVIFKVQCYIHFFTTKKKHRIIKRV